MFRLIKILLLVVNKFIKVINADFIKINLKLILKGIIIIIGINSFMVDFINYIPAFIIIIIKINNIIVIRKLDFMGIKSCMADISFNIEIRIYSYFKHYFMLIFSKFDFNFHFLKILLL